MITLDNWCGLRCLLKLCPCLLYDDKHGVGGQCSYCGKIVGYVTNEELRESIDKKLPLWW